MRKLIIAVCASVFTVLSINAQDMKSDKREMMEKLKQTYIQEELNLEEDKMREFNTIYSEYQKEKDLLRAEAREERMKHYKLKEEGFDLSDLSEEEAMKMLESKLNREEKMLELERKYLEKMVESISAKKVLEFKHLEREFRRELLHMLKDDKHQHHMKRELMEKHRHKRH